MIKYTYHLFISSIVLSLFSFLTINKGYGELYPFFTWRLFTKPSASSTNDIQYKLYGISEKDTVRLLNDNSPLFDGNEKFSMINKLGSTVDLEGNGETKKKLYRFARVIEPGYEKYLLMKESFNGQRIDQIDFKITAEIICELQ